MKYGKAYSVTQAVAERLRPSVESLFRARIQSFFGRAEDAEEGRVASVEAVIRKRLRRKRP